MDQLNELMEGLSLSERKAVLQILKEQQKTGTSTSLYNIYAADYDEIPVSVEQFIKDPYYAGTYLPNIYPFWVDQLKLLFDSGRHYSEVALTGSIGVGKSVVAIVAIAYTLYKLMCLKDPQAYYGKNKPIYIVFFNNTLGLASRVGFQAFQQLVQGSPWFMERGEIRGRIHLEYKPFKNIEISVGSNPGHVLGSDVIAALLDELNFSASSNIHMEQSKVMGVYNAIYERIATRFTQDGAIQGVMFLVSSKKSEYDFLESYIRKQKDKPHVFVADAKIWDVQPSGTYSGKKFKLAIGGSNLPSKIIPNEDDWKEYERIGYDVIEVPVEHRQSFELDMQSAIMNVAGISISHFLKFMNYEQIKQCYIEALNPFVQEVVTVGLKQTTLLQDYFMPELVPEEIYSRPIFIHIDTSLTGDKTGISGVAAMGTKETPGYDTTSGTVVSTRKLVYRHVFTVAVAAPKNDEIAFAKLIDFIFHLKFNLEWNIRGISLDGYQSAYAKQQLLSMGFADVAIVSMDRTSDGYMALKAAFAERRIALLQLELLEYELIHLERDNVKGTVDHPLNQSKDCSDSLGGALYNASLHEADLMYDLADLVEIVVAANVPEALQKSREISDPTIIDVAPEIINQTPQQTAMNIVEEMREKEKERATAKVNVKMSPAEIVAEAKRRATLYYGRTSSSELDVFSVSDRILD